MTRSITTGETIDLSEVEKVINALVITLNWRLLPNLKNPPEGDMFTFLRDKNAQAPKNEDFIFFNQTESDDETALLSEAVFNEDAEGILTGSQSITLHLNKIRYEIIDIITGFNLYRAGERDQSLRYVESLSVDISLESGVSILTYNAPLAEHKGSICLSLLKLSRSGQGWSAQALDEASPSFNDLARAHGIVVAG